MAKARKDQPQPDRFHLTDEERLARQEEVYRLHCQGLSQRAIGAQLGIGVCQVHRALTQARTAIRRQKGERYLADLAHRLTEGAWDDMAQSHQVEQQNLETEGDFRAAAIERSNRAKLRDQIAKWHGIDPKAADALALRREEMELKRRAADAADRKLATAEDVLKQWSAWACDPGDPDQAP